MAGRLHSRVPATILIAIGAFFPTLTDSLNRAGSTELFQLGKFLGVVFLFAGFLVSVEVFREIRIPFTSIRLGDRASRERAPAAPTRRIREGGHASVVPPAAATRAGRGDLAPADARPADGPRGCAGPRTAMLSPMDGPNDGVPRSRRRRGSGCCSSTTTPSCGAACTASSSSSTTSRSWARPRTAQRAVELVEQLEPDVVLMDLLMPVMDGIAATAEIKQRYPDVEVVALTSFIEEERVTAALEAGATGLPAQGRRCRRRRGRRPPGARRRGPPRPAGRAPARQPDPQPARRRARRASR